MLLIIVVGLIFLFGIVMYVCDNKFFHTYIDTVWLSITVGSGFIYGIMVLILIINNCAGPYDQGKYEERYSRLMNKVEHIDSFNKEEVIEAVNKWNTDYRTNTYGKTSLWVNWFYTIDTSTTKLIELKEI